MTPRGADVTTPHGDPAQKFLAPIKPAGGPQLIPIAPERIKKA
jgi:hypothetical protein